MAYITKDDLLKMLKEKRRREIVNDHLLGGLPYIFQDNQEAYKNFAETLSAQFGTPVGDICIIGSGRTGFSLDPDKFGTPFSVASDVDTIVVNAERFDKAWFELSRFANRMYLLSGRERAAYQKHRDNNVFFGFIEPEGMPNVLSIATHWFRTLKAVGRIREVSAHSVNGRLYRTWEHVRAHQLYSLDSIEVNFIEKRRS
jgi:hypothetical protein